jgi:transcriptional regulator with XRE-family HTH domain
MNYSERRRRLVYSTNKLPTIRKQAFRDAREALGLSVQDLSRISCYSVRQIEQIENGESSSFYGPQVKVTAAKKVAGLLKLSEESAFDFGEVTPVKKTEVDQNDPSEVSGQANTPFAAPARVVEKESLASKPVEERLTPAFKQKSSKSEALSSASVKTRSPLKRFALLLGITAALVFSIINLRPLFFPEVVKEEVVVVEQTQAAAPADVPADPKAIPPASAPESVVAATAPTPAPSTECPPADAVAVSYRPDAPKKAGDMVYLQSKTVQTVCVVDASGKIQNKTLEAGVGTSVYGKPPLKVLTSGTAQVDIYYQGVKVRLSNITAKNILLEPAEIIQPLAPTDSQFR